MIARSKIDGKTRIVTLLGFPVSHSRSPAIHNPAFNAQNLNFVYVASPVTPHDLEAAIAGLRALNFAGANVTIPHKEAVIPFLDELTPAAKAIGAVNTIYHRKIKDKSVLIGDNTDAEGFVKPLLKFAGQLKNTEAVIFGAGGAARAVIFALLTQIHPAKITLVVRNTKRAIGLKKAFESLAQTYKIDICIDICLVADSQKSVQNATLLINATPAGMHPHIDTAPWENSDDFSAGQIIYDLVYNPEETRFLKEGFSAGGITIGGLKMLKGQAAVAYKGWTGLDFPA